MTKMKKKLTPEHKAARKKRREEFMPIFINGKQKRVRRPPTIDGMVDEFIRRKAAPIFRLENEMYEELYEWELRQNYAEPVTDTAAEDIFCDDDELPF